MKRVIVVGSTSSGKSYLAKRLATKMNAPYIQLDALFWKPNWQETEDNELFEKVKQATGCNSWVIDGNYNRTNHLTWPKADTVIWLDLDFTTTLYQSITRTLKRSFTGKEIWKGTGNRESFTRMLSKDSILLWLIKTYRRNKTRYIARMNDPQYSHIKFYRLHSRHEIRQFLNNESLFKNT